MMAIIMVMIMMMILVIIVMVMVMVMMMMMMMMMMAGVSGGLRRASEGAGCVHYCPLQRGRLVQGLPSPSGRSHSEVRGPHL